MSTRISLARLLALYVGFLALAVLPGLGRAESPESDAEREARLARRGAGIRAGAWNVTGLEEVDGAERSSSPLLEGFFQKGLDKHLAWVTNASLWWRSQSITTTSGGIGGGTSTEKVNAYVVPFFTALKFHPFTTPGARVEPFVDAGAGFALGILNTESQGSGGLLSNDSSGTSFSTGFGFRAASGVDVRLSTMFSLSAQGRYQWVRFTEKMNTDDTFGGFGVDLGLTYKFQY